MTIEKDSIKAGDILLWSGGLSTIPTYYLVESIGKYDFNVTCMNDGRKTTLLIAIVYESLHISKVSP